MSLLDQITLPTLLELGFFLIVVGWAKTVWFKGVF
ncbi:hypothetical protein LYNGBM3L_24990 [Moorena producens 3L]|uniref:Uncharacterized protein n=1 Tax=Moorena producens 3L TaxID=489825 RepID=F4XP01_9CYAN|nr:hypothetical protein LYNGBM3L_24990 [Moorena producens 3L]